MDWFKLHLSFMRSPEFIGCEPVDRATWLALMAHCADQENGGLIRRCADWGNRRWMQTAGVTQEEVHHECDLWAWEGSNLRVSGYDLQSERMVKKNRTLSREAGKKSGENRRKRKSQDKIQHEPDPQPDPQPDLEQRREEKRRAEESRGEQTGQGPDPARQNQVSPSEQPGEELFDGHPPAERPALSLTPPDLLGYVRYRREERDDALASLQAAMEIHGAEHVAETVRRANVDGNRPWHSAVHDLCRPDPGQADFDWSKPIPGSGEEDAEWV